MFNASRKALVSFLIVAGILLVYRCTSFQNGSAAQDLSTHEADSKTKKAVILASYSEQDVSWLSKLPKDWGYYRYALNYDAKPYSDRFGTPLRVPANLGREAMAYTTFIIDHYDNLPEYMVFVHGHDIAWHQPTHTADKLRALNLSALVQEEFVSLRCFSDPICSSNGSLDLSKGPYSFPFGEYPLWNPVRMLPAWYKLHFLDEENRKLLPPEQFGSSGGAQFATTAQAVRKRSLDFWTSLRQHMISELAMQELDQLLRTTTLDVWDLQPPHNQSDIFGVGKNSVVNSYVMGALFEKTWHKIFGKEDWYCVSARYCNEVLFSGVIQCPDGEETDRLPVECKISMKALDQITMENERELRMQYLDKMVGFRNAEKRQDKQTRASVPE